MLKRIVDFIVAAVFRETYLTLKEAQALASRLLPGARVLNHWLWHYTIVWDKDLD